MFPSSTIASAASGSPETREVAHALPILGHGLAHARPHTKQAGDECNGSESWSFCVCDECY
eukprot:666029-Pyramimonas_sp.AAC.1